MTLRLSIVILTLCVLIFSCKPTPVQEKQARKTDPLEKPLLETNKYMKERNRAMIRAFSKRAGWEMTERPSGLWIGIREKGSGKTIERDDHVTYVYKALLLDGTLCYEANSENPKKIIAGKGSVEAGLEEALLLLKEGSKARVILPPYLAHGNFGDGKKIPGAAILLIEMEILSVK